MQVFAKEDGQKLAEPKLKCLPSFDSLIAARGGLYLAGQDGSIQCFRSD
jgi:hypothetical protein